MKVTQSYPTLCDPMNYTVHGILQTRTLEWEAFPFSRGSSQARDQTQVSHIAGRFFTSWATREVHGFPSHTLLYWSEVTQSCPTLCNPTDCSLPGSSIRGIFQARILEWVAISLSRGSSWPRDRTPVSCIVGRRFTALPSGPPGKPTLHYGNRENYSYASRRCY